MLHNPQDRPQSTELFRPTHRDVVRDKRIPTSSHRVIGEEFQEEGQAAVPSAPAFK